MWNKERKTEHRGALLLAKLKDEQEFGKEFFAEMGPEAEKTRTKKYKNEKQHESIAPDIQTNETLVRASVRFTTISFNNCTWTISI